MLVIVTPLLSSPVTPKSRPSVPTESDVVNQAKTAPKTRHRLTKRAAAAKISFFVLPLIIDVFPNPNK